MLSLCLIKIVIFVLIFIRPVLFVHFCLGQLGDHLLGQRCPLGFCSRGVSILGDCAHFPCKKWNSIVTVPDHSLSSTMDDYTIFALGICGLIISVTVKNLTSIISISNSIKVTTDS